MYLLDTDHCIAYLKTTHPSHRQVSARVASTPATDLWISHFTALELAEGPWHSTTRQDLDDAYQKVDDFLKLIQFAPFTFVTVWEFGYIRSEFHKQHQRLPDFDIAIAATAITSQLILLTNNQRHFQRIQSIRPMLMLDNWF